MEGNTVGRNGLDLRWLFFPTLLLSVRVRIGLGILAESEFSDKEPLIPKCHIQVCPKPLCYIASQLRSIEWLSLTEEGTANIKQQQTNHRAAKQSEHLMIGMNNVLAMK